MENEYYKRYEPFFGEWRIKRFIGAGSYGRVFEIERRDEFDTVYTGALKAVTIPSSQGELDEILADGMDMNGASTYFRDYVKELNREIALMSKLKGHSNIVSYEDHKMFPHEDGVGWDILIRMELLTPITSYLKQNHTFTRREVIQLGMDLCKALEICQRYNIIHRDIKPANIFISETEDFKLGDFGVARIASASTGASTRAGTVNYMAPEVFRGEKYTSNVDIYSLGLVMYQLLNNNRMPLYPPYPQPITPSSRERAQAQRLSGAALPPPANAEGRLAEIVLKACAPDPAQRYDSPTVMRQALEAILYTEGEAKMIYPEGDTVPVPSTSGAAAPEENDPNGETERPVWGKAHADSEKPAKAEKDLPECLKNARDDAPLEQQFSLRELSGLSKEEADALDLTLKPMPQPAPAAEPAAPAVPQEPAADQTVRVETAQPAAPADDSTVRLMPGAVPVQTPAEDRTERVAAPVQPVQNVQESDKTTFLFEAQAEKRRQEQQAKREAEEAARRKAAEEKEAELARIRAEKRAAEQAAAEEAARKAEAEQAAAAQAAQQQETPAAPAAPQKKGSKLPLAIGGVAVAAVVAVGGFALAGRGGASGTAAASTAEAIYTAGTYTATAEGCLSDVTVTVTVSGKAITDVRVDASGETAELGGKAAEELPSEIIRSQSTDVDGYTGATLTSDAIKKAAADCIAQASGKKAASSQAASAAASSTVASSTTVSSLSQNAADLIDSGSCGKNATWELYKDGTLYIKGTGAMQDYNWNYNETTKIVTTGAPWHDSHSASVKKLVVEDGITSIGNDAFSDCESLVSAELAEGITSIGDGAFTGCYDLEKINIPNSVTSIGYDAFDSCWTLPSLELPSGLSKLESSAVSFTAIKELTVPHGVKVVDSYLAAYNDNLTTVTLEEGVEEIWHRAFWGCEKLNNITIPRSVKKIEGEAFLECTSLKSVTISKNCNVASNAFPSTVQINYYD
ncbi:leucine-rich repeat protein [Faecalibacterium prausnitzii]|uniref:leucine-rich repeat protein n=1 Tax=Faecalibacterium prausnitzii TaxID=853 RepID=UPI00290DD2D7|nr:leucine-rich repeat protein [Faecalibacterium prausnitzii]